MKYILLVLIIFICGCSTGRPPKHVLLDNMFKGETGINIVLMTGGRPSISKLSNQYSDVYFKTPIPIFGDDKQYDVVDWKPRGSITVENTDPKLLQFCELFGVARRRFADGWMGTTPEEQSMNLEKWYDGEPVLAKFTDKHFNTVVVYSPQGKDTRTAVEMMTLTEWNDRKTIIPIWTKVQPEGEPRDVFNRSVMRPMKGSIYGAH